MRWEGDGGCGEVDHRGLGGLGAGGVERERGSGNGIERLRSYRNGLYMVYICINTRRCARVMVVRHSAHLGVCETCTVHTRSNLLKQRTRAPRLLRQTRDHKGNPTICICMQPPSAPFFPLHFPPSGPTRVPTSHIHPLLFPMIDFTSMLRRRRARGAVGRSGMSVGTRSTAWATPVGEKGGRERGAGIHARIRVRFSGCVMHDCM